MDSTLFQRSVERSKGVAQPSIYNPAHPAGRCRTGSPLEKQVSSPSQVNYITHSIVASSVSLLEPLDVTADMQIFKSMWKMSPKEKKEEGAVSEVSKGLGLLCLVVFFVSLCIRHSLS